MSAQSNLSSALHIRQANAVDIPRLIPLINTAFAEVTFLEGTRTDIARLTAIMEKGSILVAVDASGTMLGSVYTEIRGKRGYIGMLAVDPSSRRSGLGGMLTSAAEKHLCQQGCIAVDLTVLNLRSHLVSFYCRLGYVETGTEEFRPSRPLKPGVKCHCIVMSKQLCSKSNG